MKKEKTKKETIKIVSWKGNLHVACKILNCETRHATIFSICYKCDSASEINDTKLFNYLSEFKDSGGAKFDGYNLEFFGTCNSCKKN